MSTLPWGFDAVVVLVFGLLLGSFLNVLAYRLPLHESIALKPSHCPGCDTRIRWWQNVPVLSFIVLRGRCASCATRISPRYLLLEIASALTLWLVYARVGPLDPPRLVAAFAVGVLGLGIAFASQRLVAADRVFPGSAVELGVVIGGAVAALVVAAHAFVAPPPEFLLLGTFALAMLVLFVTDLEHQILPDAITVSGTVFGLGVAGWNPRLLAHHDGMRGAYQESLAGAAFGYGILWLLAAGYRRFRDVEGLGGGDLKLAAMIGAFGGPKGVVGVLLISSFAGVVFGVFLMILRRADMQSALPFGCFLAPVAAVLIVGGYDQLWPMWEAFVLRGIFGLDANAM